MVTNFSKRHRPQSRLLTAFSFERVSDIVWTKSRNTPKQKRGKVVIPCKVNVTWKGKEKRKVGVYRKTKKGEGSEMEIWWYSCNEYFDWATGPLCALKIAKVVTQCLWMYSSLPRDLKRVSEIANEWAKRSGRDFQARGAKQIKMKEVRCKRKCKRCVTICVWEAADFRASFAASDSALPLPLSLVAIPLANLEVADIS